MDAPPTYEEALASKTQGGNAGAPLIKPGAPGAPPFNPYYPNNDASSAPRPQIVASPPPLIHSHSYQHPQVYQQPQVSIIYRQPPPITVQMIPTTTTRTVIVEKHSDVNHCLHCCITLLFWPWIFVWIFLCLVSD